MDLRSDFPIFQNVKGLVYLDSASTSQKPAQVIEAVSRVYRESYANVHRAAYPLSQKATGLYEDARKTVARFINARPEDLVFTKGATESINLAASSFPFSKGDEVVSTMLEHHSNLIPWQQAAKAKGLRLKVVDIDSEGNLKDPSRYITPKTRLVAVSGMSNVLGVRPDIKSIARTAHESGAAVLVDGAQLVAHRPVDVKALGIDMLAFSAHKMLGPTGIGALWARPEVWESMAPYQTGGGMVGDVTSYGAAWGPMPVRFEAGTPNIAGAAGFAEAVRYLSRISMALVGRIEDELARYARDGLSGLDGVTLLGPKQANGIISFDVEGASYHDVATLLAQRNISIRSGHHCAAPLVAKLGLSGTNRVSLYLYNNKADVDALIGGLADAIKILR